MDEVKPWERQPGEPPKAFHAFCHFRDQEPGERTTNQAFKAHQTKCLKKPEQPAGYHYRPNKRWQTWKRQWNWESRVESHDRDVDTRKRAARLKEIEDMNTRHAGIAKVVTGKIIERLQTLQGSMLTPAQIAILMREATAIERRALGQATDIVQAQEPEKVVDLTKFNEEELDAYERLLLKGSSSGDANAT